MPQLGETIAEGTIGRWLKQVGEAVDMDEPLVEIITDKVNAEVPSPAAGVLGAILVDEGETVDVGVEIAAVDEESVGVGASTTVATRAAEQTPVQPAATPATSHGKADASARVSPLVKRLARENGVDLTDVAGTGTGGRVTKDDILGFVQRRDQAAPGQPASDQASDVREVPISPSHRAMANRMAASASTIPHAWLLMEVDATNLVQRRASEQRAFQSEHGFELTYLPLVAKAVIEALCEHPAANSRWAGDRLLQQSSVHLSIAVATEHGLMVPVIHSAESLGVTDLASAIRSVVQKARAGRLDVNDIQGGTFTLNNTGALGSIASQPIINHPQAAILNMEAIVKRPVVVNGDAIAVRSMMNLCLSFDHRVMDGQQAAGFLQAIKQKIESSAPGRPLE
jgi:2-oxoisovalerate dehydrogenase E2 component (dihydrolipoyl transacylase)